MLRLSLALAVALVAAPAWAQSKKYPAAPVDKDLEREQRSKLWEQAILPGSSEYQDLIGLANQSLTERRPEEAIEKLTLAIKGLPQRYEAFALRGSAYSATKQWTQCADDLALADDRMGSATCAVEMIDSNRNDTVCIYEQKQLRRDLGLCQARAGRYSEAERTLSRASATGAIPPELLTRLGEVRVAMGKLDEGIAALTAALDATPDGASEALTHWLLAAAYDRQRHPKEAADHARDAVRYDTAFTLLENPQLPLLGAGESDYLKGLAYLTEAKQLPEYALLYFRRFLKAAPQSPWRKRAEEHVRDIQVSPFPQRLVPSGSVVVDADVARAAVKKHFPAMRACLDKLPTVAMSVEITKTGPRTPDNARDRIILRMPPAGTKVEVLADSSVPSLEIDNARRCIEGIASKIAMPSPKERDTWSRVTFYVVAP